MLLIIYGFGFITGRMIPMTPIGNLGLSFFIFAPLWLPFLVIWFWWLAIPYFAATFGLLYWWEKRKQKIKEGS